MNNINSNMSDIKFAILNKHTVSKLAFHASADPGQESLLDLGDGELID